MARFDGSWVEGVITTGRLEVAAVEIGAGLSTMPVLLDAGLKYDSIPVCVSMRITGFGTFDEIGA